MSKTRWHLSQEPSTLVPSDRLALGALNRFQLSQVKGAIIDVLQCSAKRCRAPLAKSHNSITAPTFTASFFKKLLRAVSKVVVYVCDVPDYVLLAA